MEFTELADYALPAGHLTEWIPTTGDNLKSWAIDDRPLTYEHGSHYLRGSGSCSENDWLGAVFEIHHRYDRDAVRRTLTTWMRRHEAFRTTVTKGPDTPDDPNVLRRSTNSGEQLDVTPLEVGLLRTGTRVHQHLAELFDTKISPLQWPHCLAATITGDNTSGRSGFLLIFGADHSVMDAYSMLLSINEIQRIYGAELYGTDAGLPAIGSHIDFSTADRAIGSRLDFDDPVVTTWRQFLDSSGGEFPMFCLPVTPKSSAIAPHSLQNGSSSWLLSATEADSISSHSRLLGTTLASAVIAALALASRELSGEDTLRFVMPMHTRTESQYAESVGWYVGMIPVEVDITGLDTFADCVDAAADSVSSTKSFSRFPFPRVAQLLGHHSAPRFVVSYLDVRFVPGAGDWEQWHARTLRSTAYSNDEVYMWIARTPVGMTISARYPGNNVATTNVHGFIDVLGAILGDVAHSAVAVLSDSVEGNRAATLPLSSLTALGSRDKFPA